MVAEVIGLGMVFLLVAPQRMFVCGDSEVWAGLNFGFQVTGLQINCNFLLPYIFIGEIFLVLLL